MNVIEVQKLNIVNESDSCSSTCPYPGSGSEKVAGTCECGNEPLGSMECREFLN